MFRSACCSAVLFFLLTWHFNFFVVILLPLCHSSVAVVRKKDSGPVKDL